MKTSMPFCPHCFVFALLLAISCSSGDSKNDDDTASETDDTDSLTSQGTDTNGGNGTDTDTDTLQMLEIDTGWPNTTNAYSWDGSWNPTPDQLPPDGLYDTIYFDGHDVDGSPSPILPPGEWDWNGTAELAQWRGFQTRLGDMSPLTDSNDKQFGWRLERAEADGVDADAVLEVFHGSSGTDILDFGPNGSIHSAGNPEYGDAIQFGDGPDMLRFRTCYSMAVRTGSTETGYQQDNDLVLMGSEGTLEAGEYDVITAAVHTGPGSDLIFVNNWERAAVDAGNGANGRTDTIDNHDGADMVIIDGNARDFRVMGGNGADIFVWHVDNVNQEPDTWLGPNFFGGGSWGDALWGDSSNDTLILNIPTTTQLVAHSKDTGPGTLLVMLEDNYDTVIDTPTEDSWSARYYVKGPVGPQNEHTLTLQYMSSDSSVNTAYFYISSIETLQIGIDDSAIVYSLNQQTGEATLEGEPFTNIPTRSVFEDRMDTFLK